MDFRTATPARPPFHVRETGARRDGRAHLAVAGELDRDHAGELLTAVEAVWCSGRRVSVLVDLRQVGFLDAAGARCLVECRLAAARRGLTFTVHDPRPPVRRVLEILGLVDLLTG